MSKKTGIETLDSRGRINLAKYVAKDDHVFLMEQHADGKIVLTPAEVVPKTEKPNESKHGGFVWGQKVRIKETAKGNASNAAQNGRIGRIEGFQLGNPLVASVRFLDHGSNVAYAYYVHDLEAM